MLAVQDGMGVDRCAASGADCVSAPGKKIPSCGGNFRLTGNDPGSAVNIQVERFMPESGGGTVRSV